MEDALSTVVIFIAIYIACSYAFVGKTELNDYYYRMLYHGMEDSGRIEELEKLMVKDGYNQREIMKLTLRTREDFYKDNKNHPERDYNLKLMKELKDITGVEQSFWDKLYFYFHGKPKSIKQPNVKSTYRKIID
jgi:hypothetical protein